MAQEPSNRKRSANAPKKPKATKRAPVEDAPAWTPDLGEAATSPATPPTGDPMVEPEPAVEAALPEPAEPKPAPIDPAPRVPQPSPPPVSALPSPPPSPPPAREPPHVPHWEPVARAERPAPPATFPVVEQDEEAAWIRRSTLRTGSPELAALGWFLCIIGLWLIGATYWWGSVYGSLLQPMGLRADYLGAILLVLGIALGLVFLFYPRDRPTGLPADPSATDLSEALRYANGQVLLCQLLVAAGLSVLLIDALWAGFWLRWDYLNDTTRTVNVAGYDVRMFLLLTPLAIIAALTLFFCWGKLGSARRARNATLVAALRAKAPTAATSGVAAVGEVSAAEIQALLKRLDGLMAQLPEEAVTEFSKTPEADTYLRLIGP